MSITTACPSCDQRLKVKSKYAGKRVKCPECSGRIRIPAEDRFESSEEEDERPARRRRRRSTSRKPPVARAVPTRGTPRPKSGLGRSSGAPKTGSARRPGLARSGSRGKSSSKASGARRSGTARRRPAPKSEGGGFFSGMGIRIGIAVVLGLIGAVVSLFSGSAAFNQSYAKVKVGMTRAQVVEVMGTPDVAEPSGAGEVLGFEAIDYQGRRKAAKHTFYFVVLESNRVVDKKRLSEAEFNRMVR